MALADRRSDVARGLRVRFGSDARALAARKPSVWLSLAQITLHVLSAICAAGLTVLAWRESPVVGVVLYPLAAFYIGSRFRALGNMLHEAVHSLLAPSRGANTVLGYLLSFLDFTSLQAYRREHLTHHSFLGDPVKDLDYAPRRVYLAGQHGSFLMAHVLRPLSLFHLARYLRPLFWDASDGLLANVSRVAYCLSLLAIAHWLTGWIAFALFFVAPYLTTYQVLRYWSDAFDHAGIAEEPEEFYRARNHTLAFRLLSAVLFPRNDEYHLVHHLFPAVGTRELPTLHQMLLRDALYAGREHELMPLVWPSSARRVVTA